MVFNKKIYLIFFIVMMFFVVVSPFVNAYCTQSEIQLDSTAVVLMEASTGKEIITKNPDMELRPASITKIMTLLLIFDAIQSGILTYDDIVSVSEHAASLGGSQVYLEPGETQTVREMIKCISIASANDASVAMAERVSGSEESFVAAMNQRAAELGMKNTRFVNCYGLDTDGHVTTARDVALMSRELITKHPEISDFSTIWMDTISHKTARGTSEFGLTNTNKLIKSFSGITGLKTGSTGLAKYCLSATAKRDNVSMIAVVMSAPDTKTRFAEAAKLLNYGFANCKLYTDSGEGIELLPVRVNGGVKDECSIAVRGSFSYVCLSGFSPEQISRKAEWSDCVEAPVKEGDQIGKITYMDGTTVLGTLDLVAGETVNKATFGDCFRKGLLLFF